MRAATRRRKATTRMVRLRREEQSLPKEDATGKRNAGAQSGSRQPGRCPIRFAESWGYALGRHFMRSLRSLASL
ncbi:MAG TPA: hypothetical protein VJM47_05715 [Nitrosospira sp.]|nr:hypothetical protein [Nitrosospira sp.]